MTDAGWGRIHNEVHGQVPGSIFQVGRMYGDVIVNGLKPASLSLMDLETVAEVDPLAAGVHRAGEAVPPYIERDRDRELREEMRRIGREGGLLVITGDSTAGKTRSAFEAAHRLLPGHRFLAPTEHDDLRALPSLVTGAGPDERLVLWLDDIERYLGSSWFSPGLMGRLAATGVAIVATVRSRYRDMIRGRADHGDRSSEWETGRRVLNIGTSVDLDRLWSSAELARVARSDDARLVDALRHHSPYGIAEYLAAGPQLLEKWRDGRRPSRQGGHPMGYALVAAAVDLVRVGLLSPIPLSVLWRLRSCYMEGTTALEPESLGEAMAWSTAQQNGVASLLVPANRRRTSWRAFDYLVDAAPDTPIPEQVERTALEQADQTDLVAIVLRWSGVASAGGGQRFLLEPGAGEIRQMLIPGLLLSDGEGGLVTRLLPISPNLSEEDTLAAVEEIGELEDEGRGYLWSLVDEPELALFSQDLESLLRRGGDSTDALNEFGVILYRSAQYEWAREVWGVADELGHAEAMRNLMRLPGGIDSVSRADEDDWGGAGYPAPPAPHGWGWADSDDFETSSEVAEWQNQMAVEDHAALLSAYRTARTGTDSRDTDFGWRE